jgi:acyl-ACP thioesterase
MPVAPRIELPFRVRFDECGPDGRLRDSGLLRYAQEAAWVHSEAAGFDRGWYAEHRLTWLVRVAEVVVLEPIAHGESVTVSTEVVGWRRVWARRRSVVAGAGGGTRSEAHIDWVLLGPAGRPVRVPAEIAGLFAGRAVEGYEPGRVSLDPAPEDARRVDVAVRPHDLDPMDHVNNAVYLDYATEALLEEPRAAHALTARPRRWRMEFVRPAGAGERLVGSAWADEDGWAYRLQGADGDESFRARLSTAS